jgi:hypothetical protein
METDPSCGNPRVGASMYTMDRMEATQHLFQLWEPFQLFGHILVKWKTVVPETKGITKQRGHPQYDPSEGKLRQHH